MDEEKARKILGDTVQEDGSLYNLGHYINWEHGDTDIVLDDRFTVEELVAIVWWMQH